MSTVKQFVASFHPIDQVPAKMTSIQQPNAGQSIDFFSHLPGTVASKAANHPVSSSTYASSAKSAAKTMVSISPIRFDNGPYPTQQLTAQGKAAAATKVTAPVTRKEEPSTPKDHKASTVPYLPDPVMSGSKGVIKNLSTQFNETSATRTLENRVSTAITRTNVPVKQETDDFAEAIDSNYNSYACFGTDSTPIQHEEFDLDTGFDGVPIKQEPIDFDANLYASFSNPIPTFTFEGLPTDSGVIDESKLDEFTLHSNGSFEGIESFPPTELYPQIIVKQGPNTNKPGKPNTNKPKHNNTIRKRGKVLTNASTTGVEMPGPLDILRGRGGEPTNGIMYS